MLNESDERIAEGIKILEQAIQERQEDRDALAKQLADLDAQQEGSRQLLRQFEEEQNMRVLKNRKIDTDWAKIMEPDPWYGNDAFRQEMRKLMLGKPGFDWSGIDAQTGGYAFRIAIYREDVSPFYMALLEQAIQTILPFIKPQENGQRRIKLMEPSLSEFGSYNVFEENGEWILGIGRGSSRYRVVATASTLADMLQHLAENYAMRSGE